MNKPTLNNRVDHHHACAADLAAARRNATALDRFPVAVPETLEDAYAIQAEASRLWADEVVGWKVGRITGDLAQRCGKDRFVGPIFARTVSEAAPDDAAMFPVIHGGSAAFEAELVMLLGEDIAPSRTDWRVDEVKAFLSDVRLGIEVAGSPVREIGRLGALASIAAYGNNMALILGPPLDGWKQMSLDGVACCTVFDETVMGTDVAGSLPGGPLAAVAFALNQCAELGIALRAGTWLSTGAITGVHDVGPDQDCVADFGIHGAVRCRTAAVPALQTVHRA